MLAFSVSSFGPESARHDMFFLKGKTSFQRIARFEAMPIDHLAAEFSSIVMGQVSISFPLKDKPLSGPN